MRKLGLGLGLNKRNNISSGVSYDVATQAVISYATTQGYTLPSGPVLLKLDTLLAGLKSDGIWDSLDIIYAFKTDGDRDFAKINLKDPGTYDCTEIGTPVFTTNKGFDSNGGLNGLDTNWNPSSNGVNFTLNNASLFAWNFEQPQALGLSQSGCGVETAIGKVIIRQLHSTNVIALHSVNQDVNSVTLSKLLDENPRLYHAVRTASNANALYINGMLYDSELRASSSMPNSNLYVCGYNAEGTLSNPYTGNISILGVGASLSTKASELYTMLNTYITSI